MQPDVSVIIPLYNKEKYIEKAISSVVNQTHENFELIVVDDGSTDSGPEKVRSLVDERIIIISQENMGPGSARNKGINASRGRYIAFLDADDEWENDFLARSMSILENNKDCDVVVSNYYLDESVYFPKDKNVLRSDILAANNIKVIEGAWRLQSDIADTDLRSMICQFWTSVVFVKKNIISKYPFYEKNKCCYGEDLYVWLQLAVNHKIYFNPEPLAHYHTVNSDLAVGREACNKLEAFLIDPETIMDNCKDENRDLLEKWLVFFAFESARNRLALGKTQDVQFLLNKFPNIKKMPGYWLLAFKLKFPGLYKFLKKIKNI